MWFKSGITGMGVIGDVIVVIVSCFCVQGSFGFQGNVVREF